MKRKAKPKPDSINERYDPAVPLAKIKPHPKNPRKGNLPAIEASIEANGFYGACVVQKSTGRILAGNHRYLAAKAKGLETIPVIWVDCDDDRALRILLADNRTNDLATYDDAALAEILKQAQDTDAGLVGTGYDDAALQEILTQIQNENPKAGLTDPDAVPEPPKETITKTGDLWLMGEHRLLCGDATNQSDVGKLLAGNVPFLIVTDPPYGVNYDPTWRKQAGVNNNPGKQGKVLNDDNADWTKAWILFPGDVMYVWHVGTQASVVQNSIEQVGFVIRSQIIWEKDRFALSRGDYHWQHEPCWYAVRNGKASNWAGDRSQTTTWKIAAREDGGSGHGTQKPFECMARPIINHKSDGVYDPFCGSGTTMIAAEKLGRKCYAMEISPVYCDVIVKRWEDFTGNKAALSAKT